jgi:hypothetical protein
MNKKWKKKHLSKIWHPIFISNSPFFTGSSWVQSHTPCSGQPMCVYGYQGRRDIRTLGMNLPENIWQKEIPKFNLCLSWKYGQFIPRVTNMSAGKNISEWKDQDPSITKEFTSKLASAKHTKSYWTLPMYSWFTYKKWWCLTIVFCMFTRG